VSDYPALDPHDNECGIVVPAGVTLLGISDETGLAVALRSVVAFTRGLVLEVDLLAREPANSHKWQDVTSTSDADGLQVGFAFAGDPALMPASVQSLDSVPIWLLQRAGGGDTRFSIAWWVAPYPSDRRLIVGLEWPRAGITRSTVAVDLPSSTDLQQRIVRVWDGDGS
jgi:hypothetical protein